MYRIGHRARYRNGLTIVAGCIIIVSIGFGIWGLLTRDVRGVVITGDNQAITTQVAGDSTDDITIDEPLFTMKLPKDWVLNKKDQTPNLVYYFKATKKYADSRNLNIFIDDSSADLFAVNRMVPVTGLDNKLSVGQVSDNCAQFTGTGTPSAQAAQSQKDTVARWQGVSFLCDLSHVNRNAVGISSGEGINQVTLTGASGQKHRYFLVYTDHSDQPDYSIFNDALASFEAK
jgi:hypothetical protein